MRRVQYPKRDSPRRDSKKLKQLSDILKNINRGNFSRLLFVYGLLKKSYNHNYPDLLMDELQYICQASANGLLYDLGEFPAAFFDKNQSEVIHGEIYQLPKNSNHLSLLDEFEDVHASTPMYERIIISVQTDQGQIACWAYQYLGERNKPIIESGIF